jgi:PAS domain S-box-containing protein
VEFAVGEQSAVSDADRSSRRRSDQELQRCLDDVGRVLDTLLDMLDLDFVGLRFHETEHIFLRASQRLSVAHATNNIAGAIASWLSHAPERRPAALTIGMDSLSVVSVPLGGIASIGLLVAGSRSERFPSDADQLRLRVAATQTGLACREVRDLGDRGPPPDMRPEKPTGEALAESEWRLNLIINTMPAIAWSATPDGLLDFVNQHFCDFVGLTSEEILGLGFYRIFHPDDTPHLLSAWQDIMSSKVSREVEGRLMRADGEYRWCTLRQNPLLDRNGQIIAWYGVVLDIEARKNAENALQVAQTALRASEQNLNLIINSLPVLAWSARPDGSSDFVNQSWTDYVGVSAERILEWGFLAFYHPDDIPGMVETWKRDLEHSDRTSLKGRIRGGDNTYRWFYFSGRKITDANGVVRWFGVNVDIEDLQRTEDALKASESALRKSEAALRESEHRLNLAINTVPAMIWSTTPDGLLDFWNQILADYAGLPLEEALGVGFYQIFHPDDVNLLRSTWEGVLASKVPRPVDGRIRRFDGVYRWFALRQSPLLDAAGNVVKWYGVFIDIEDRRRAEEELRRTQSDLAHVSRMMTMGELAVSIAHEVNQPLMGIVTNAGTCLRWLDDAQLNVALARQAAERIVEDGHRAGDIVTSIRSLARKSAPDVQRISIEELVREVLDLLNGEFRARGVSTRLDFGPKPTEIMGDRIQLQQVVMNLVMNAVEAMCQIGAGHRLLTVSTAVGTDFVEVSVFDTGTGLTHEDKERVFVAFYTTKPEGIGMGLSICRSIVEAHDGRIWASDNLPSGSVFRFTLPLSHKGQNFVPQS